MGHTLQKKSSSFSHAPHVKSVTVLGSEFSTSLRTLTIREPHKIYGSVPPCGMFHAPAVVTSPSIHFYGVSLLYWMTDFMTLVMSVIVRVQRRTKKYVNLAKQDPRQGQAEQLSKGKNKTLATTYKPFCLSL